MKNILNFPDQDYDTSEADLKYIDGILQCQKLLVENQDISEEIVPGDSKPIKLV